MNVGLCIETKKNKKNHLVKLIKWKINLHLDLVYFRPWPTATGSGILKDGSWDFIYQY